MELAEGATKGRSISAAVALLNHPAKRTLQANGPQWWAGRIPTDKPDPRTCPSHRETNKQDNLPIGSEEPDAGGGPKRAPLRSGISQLWSLDGIRKRCRKQPHPLTFPEIRLGWTNKP